MSRRAFRSERHGLQAGFSLLELLVALALLATLTVLLMSALQFGTSVWRRSDPAASSVDLGTAYRTLRTNIERALPIPLRGEHTTAAPVAFDGTPDVATFVVANPGRVGLLGDTVLRLAISRNQREPFLGLSWAPYDPQHELSVDSFKETLMILPDVRSASFQYFGVKDDGVEGAAWARDWRHQGALPRLVGLDFETADGRRRSWRFRIELGR